MATGVIMPALEMAQESGVLVSWLKRDGESVVKGEPLMEIETDKVTVEIEAPASGVLGGILAHEGDAVPVGQTIAWILAPGETPPAFAPLSQPGGRTTGRISSNDGRPAPSAEVRKGTAVEVSPLARKIAEENAVDLSLIEPAGRRIEKADVLAFLDATRQPKPAPANGSTGILVPTRLIPASPKARRLAAERGVDIATLKGSGPAGAVLAADVPLDSAVVSTASDVETPGTVWRLMAEHMAVSWTTVPHFYLLHEVDAGNLIEWRKQITLPIEKRTGISPTYTDLLIKLVGVALRKHPRLNAAWREGGIQWNQEINVGIAVAVEDGLIVPVVRNADAAPVSEIATQRHDLVERAQTRRLRPADIAGSTFTLSNLGMHNVDAFNAIVNTPQAALLAVGRIVERVVARNGQAVVRPMMTLSLSCDHRVVDGARAAQFLDDLSTLTEEPWELLA